MGYRSDIAIAMTQEVYARNLIDPFIPAVLMEEPHEKIGDSVYWFLAGWKWYDSYSEVNLIEEMFSELDTMTDLSKPEEIRLGDTVIECPPILYGALRVGEDDGDNQSWGEPWEFDININRHIDSPFNGG